MRIYILRRLVLMIPTLFGVTVVSFCIMQMAPGDPLAQQAGAMGAGGQTGQTREAYLVQKRDLRLDKPLLLNFNYFRDYTDPVYASAYYLGRTLDQIAADLGELADAAPGSAAERRRRFLQSLNIPRFDEAIANPELRARLARSLIVFVQIYCEDHGPYAVPAAIALLESDSDPTIKIGTVRALANMVLNPFVYTYTRDPDDGQSDAVVTTWSLWWERARDTFAPLPEERQRELRERIAELSRLTDRSELFERIEYFSRDDMPVFAETLLGDSTLEEKVICATALRLYVGQPLRVDVPLDATPDQIAEVSSNWIVYYQARQAQYQPGWLERTLWVFTDTQYAHMVWRLVTFQFGRSALRTREPVSQKIWNAFLVSAPLMVLAQIFIYAVAVPAGILCAVHRNGWIDRSVSMLLFILFSIPNFVAGMLFLLFLCYGQWLKIFPMLGLHSADADSFGPVAFFLDYLWHITLPVTCLALFSLAGLAMYARTSMLDVIGQDFIRTARAKGLGERTVILKHALRNALIPVITLFANFLPAMLGGSVLIEYLFGIPGMGRLSWESIEQKDFPTLMALIYIDAIVVMVSILISDLLYVLVDPRISFSGRRST